MLVLNMYGMRRSGQHGIINWFCENAAQTNNVHHIDDCRIGIEPNYLWSGTRKRVPSKFIHGLDADILICNFEDRLIENYRGWFPEDADVRDIIILRDPYNMIASRIKYNQQNNNICDGTQIVGELSMWKIHALCCLTIPSVSCFLYNSWFKDKNYREQLMKYFDLKFNDKGLQQVKLGNSSFDNTAFDGKAQQMDVLNRWRSLTDKEWTYFDKQTISLCIKLFGFSIDPKTKVINYADNFNSII